MLMCYLQLSTILEGRMEMTQVKYITAYLISYISEYCPGTNLGGEYNAKYFVFIPL